MSKLSTNICSAEISGLHLCVPLFSWIHKYLKPITEEYWGEIILLYK